MEKTIKWHKVKCSFYKQTLGFDERKRGCWKALCSFIEHHIAFDYEITAMYDEMPDDVVEIAYDEDAPHKYTIVKK